jgi:hypothetical protein
MDGDAVMAGMVQGLRSFDVETAVRGRSLVPISTIRCATYAQLSHDARFAPFLRSLAARDTPFFMGAPLSSPTAPWMRPRGSSPVRAN